MGMLHASNTVGPAWARAGAVLLSLLAVGTGGCERPPRQLPASSSASESAARSKTVERLPSGSTEVEGQGKKDEGPQGPDAVQSATEASLGAPVFSGDPQGAFAQSFLVLSSWVKKKQGRIYAALVDLETDQWLVKQDAELPVNVASNAKVPTAAAALSLLGPAYRFKTELFGDLSQDGKVARLVLRGGGAPDLQTADLYRFVAVLKGRGVVQVPELVVDQSLFDERYVPPAFEQQPSEWAPFRANV